jgi:hypothetical protein
MRRDFISPLANIQLDNRCSVNGEALVWINHNTEEARVYGKNKYIIIKRGCAVILQVYF